MTSITELPTHDHAEQLIPALVPDAVAARRCAPARLPTLPSPPASALSLPVQADIPLVGSARVDRSGRLKDKHLFSALGWTPDQHLDLDTEHSLIVLASNPSGRHVIDRRGAITLPAATCHMCGVEPGRPLVLAASVRDQVLVIHPAVVIGQLLATHYAELIGACDDC